MVSRRQLLAGSAALALAPRTARAEGKDLKFIFVVVFRGWDVTRVYAPEFDNPIVSMEVDAEAATVGGLTFVDHGYRPVVRSFFETWHDRAVIVNGISVPSLGHVECLHLSLTGTNSATAPDWPAQIAAAAQSRYPLPHVVVNGPNFSGSYGGYVTRVGSTAWVEQVLDGSVLANADDAPRAFSAGGQAAMDSAVASFSSAAAARAAEAREIALYEAHKSSLERLAVMKTSAADLAWPEDATLPSQAGLAVDLLRLGLTRVVTLAHDYVEWDSHAENDELQSSMFADLYAGLADLMDRLVATPGTSGGTLADETVVVVLSEMGRTPQLNGGAGKDHWPHTSALILGPNVAGDRVIGGFDDLFTGQSVDLATGDVTESGETISTRTFGATLLALADIDPEDAPIEAILA